MICDIHRSAMNLVKMITFFMYTTIILIFIICTFYFLTISEIFYIDISKVAFASFFIEAVILTF